jgi:hypothetical protein
MSYVIVTDIYGNGNITIDPLKDSYEDGEEITLIAT